MLHSPQLDYRSMKACLALFFKGYRPNEYVEITLWNLHRTLRNDAYDLYVEFQINEPVETPQREQLWEQVESGLAMMAFQVFLVQGIALNITVLEDATRNHDS